MGACNGNCAACSGCGRALELTGPEIDFLKLLGQYAFLPVARKREDPAPVYPEGENREEASRVLLCLEKKGLICLDFDAPLRGVPEEAYEGYPIRGSMALTARGQTVLELMEYQGVQEG